MRTSELKTAKVSEYHSENLMYELIKEVLNGDRFLKYGVLMHFPVRNLIRDFSKQSGNKVT